LTMEPALPRLFTSAEVAWALQVSESYVRQKARAREWPHRRGPRGTPLFSRDDVAQILELMKSPVVAPTEPRVSFAPKSRRRIG
jgi:hypothetical protein